MSKRWAPPEPGPDWPPPRRTERFGAADKTALVMAVFAVGLCLAGVQTHGVGVAVMCGVAVLVGVGAGMILGRAWATGKSK